MRKQQPAMSNQPPNWNPNGPGAPGQPQPGFGPTAPWPASGPQALPGQPYPQQTPPYGQPMSPQRFEPSRPEGMQQVVAGTAGAVCFLQDVHGGLQPNPRPCHIPNYHVHAIQVVNQAQQAGFANEGEAHATYRASVRQAAIAAGIKLVLLLGLLIALITQIGRARQLLIDQSGGNAQIRKIVEDSNPNLMIYIALGIFALAVLSSLLRIVVEASTYLEIRKLDSAFVLYRARNWMVWEKTVDTIQFNELRDCDIIKRNSLFGTQRIQFNSGSRINLDRKDAEKVFALAQAISIQNKNAQQQHHITNFNI